MALENYCTRGAEVDKVLAEENKGVVRNKLQEEGLHPVEVITIIRKIAKDASASVSAVINIALNLPIQHELPGSNKAVILALGISGLPGKIQRVYLGVKEEINLSEDQTLSWIAYLLLQQEFIPAQ